MSKPFFLGDSVWRDAPRTLDAASARAIAAELEKRLDAMGPTGGVKVPTSSLADAKAIARWVRPTYRPSRFIFAPAVPFEVDAT